MVKTLPQFSDQLLLPYSEVEMVKYIVSTAVNSPKLNEKSLVNPL